MAQWTAVQASATDAQTTAVVEQAAKALAGLPLAVLRNRRELGSRAEQAVREVLRAPGGPPFGSGQLVALIAQVIARVGGLGFLDGLLPPTCTEFTDLALNGDGRVWGRRKGGDGNFAELALQPSKAEAWRAVEALLAPEGRGLSESTPSIDVKLPRDREFGFGGARVKAMHPCIAPGDGYPILALRLFEPEPVTPSQIMQWQVFSRQASQSGGADGPAPLAPSAMQVGDAVLDPLLAAVANRLRFMVIGGTSTGKTTLLSALCHGIPAQVRVVKVEDPEEIWLPHPNVVTLEARAAPPGSSIPTYEVKHGVDDAMRLAPAYLIVGEVRRGDAALSLFRALMSDHAGLTTFHAEGPEHAVSRLSIMLWGDTQTPAAAVKALFAEALDVVVQVGWRDGRRQAIGVWEIAGLTGGDVKFKRLWQPGDERVAPISRRRG
ncbi:MAG: CpaF/VirB11 family protein [Chloroflexi bacterium]|nr:CpaF/VirB11 family protein [Chloroflexota bacterium]